jgi:hypothetical protein
MEDREVAELPPCGAGPQQRKRGFQVDLPDHVRSSTHDMVVVPLISVAAASSSESTSKQRCSGLEMLSLGHLALHTRALWVG